jgi:hypothetical protein
VRRTECTQVHVQKCSVLSEQAWAIKCGLGCSIGRPLFRPEVGMAPSADIQRIQARLDGAALPASCGRGLIFGCALEIPKARVSREVAFC